MSNAATKWAWDQLDVAGSEKLVLVRLADHAHPDGTSIRPGMRSLMAHTGLSERQIRRYIQGFLDRGWIAYEDNEKGGRGNIPTFYIPAVKADADDRLSEHERGTPTSAKKSQRRTPMTEKADTHDRTYKEEPSRTVNTQVADRKIIHVAAPKKSPRPEHGPAQQIMAAFCDAIGIERLTNYSVAGGQAKNLVKAGITADDIPDMVAWAFDQDWLKGGIDLGTLYRHADKWQSDRRKRDMRKPAGPPVDLLPGEVATEIGPGQWDLEVNGRKRRIRPEYHGVIFDERKHLYSGLQDFWDEVNEAKAREERIA